MCDTLKVVENIRNFLPDVGNLVSVACYSLDARFPWRLLLAYATKDHDHSTALWCPRTQKVPLG